MVTKYDDKSLRSGDSRSDFPCPLRAVLQGRSDKYRHSAEELNIKTGQCPSYILNILASHDETGNGVEIDPLGSQEIAGLSTLVLLLDNLLRKVFSRLYTKGRSHRSHLLIDFKKAQMSELH